MKKLTGLELTLKKRPVIRKDPVETSGRLVFADVDRLQVTSSPGVRFIKPL